MGSLVQWTSNEPAQMNTFQTSGVRLSDRDVNGHYMCLSSFTGKHLWEKVSDLRWNMPSDRPVELFIKPQSGDSSARQHCLFGDLAWWCLSVWAGLFWWTYKRKSAPLCRISLFGMRGACVTYPTCLGMCSHFVLPSKWVCNFSWQFLKESYIFCRVFST